MNIATVLGGSRAWLRAWWSQRAAGRVGAAWLVGRQRPATASDRAHCTMRSRAALSVPLALATVAILLGIASGTVYAHTKSSEGSGVSELNRLRERPI